MFYGRSLACIFPSAFFVSSMPRLLIQWFRSTWSWSMSCGFQISSYTTSKHSRYALQTEIIIFFVLLISRSSADAGARWRWEVNLNKKPKHQYLMVKKEIEFHYNLSGGRGAIQARRLMDHHQQRCFLLSSHSHYFYLSYEIWLISPRHSGNSFELF